MLNAGNNIGRIRKAFSDVLIKIGIEKELSLFTK